MSRTPLQLAVHTGAGDRPVLLIHGLTRSAKLDWIEPGWPEALAAAGRGWIAPDLPGHGETAAAGSDGFSHAELIAALVGLIEETGQDAAVVIGYSLGAALSWALAATGRVRRLVIGGLGTSDPMAGLDVDALRSVVRGDQEPADERLAKFAGIVALPGLDTNGMLSLIEALVQKPFDPSVDVPTVPTLVVGGTDDSSVSGLDRVAAAMPSATYRAVPGDHGGALMSEEFRSSAIEFVIS